MDLSAAPTTQSLDVIAGTDRVLDRVDDASVNLLVTPWITPDVESAP